MARKNIESLYDVLFNMRAAMEDICQDAEGLLNDVSEYGGELNRVVKEQLSKYFIPGVSKLIKDEQTPGSIIGLIRFMDSLPLAMTRVEPSVENVAPVMPNNAKIEAPAASTVDALPQNASFQNPVNTEAPVQESRKKLENKKFAESFEFVEPKDIFKQMLKDSGNEETGPFGRQNPITEDGFYLEWQNASYEVNYDPYDGTWYIHSEFDVDDTYSDEEYDEVNYTKSGRGWNNMVDAMFGDPDLGSYPIHKGLVYNTGVEKTAKDYYIENFKLHESKKEVKRPFQNNHSKLTESDNYCGVPGVRMIWHGEWADPEIEYKGKLYSYTDMEDDLLGFYRDEHPEDENDDGFADWVRNNPDDVYYILNEMDPIEDSNYSESIHCENKLTESFENLSIEEVEKIAKEEDSKLNEILNTKVSELPNKVKYSFDERDWNDAIEHGMTYLDFLKNLAKNHRDFKFIVSKVDDKILGWMAYSPIKGLVGNIKFGSLTFDSKDNLKLLGDCKNQLISLLDDYFTVMWFASEDNNKVYNYYLKLVNDYSDKGYSAGVQDVDGSKLFYISRTQKYIDSLNHNENKLIEAKEEKCCCEETCKYQVIRTSKMESALGKDVANLEPQVVAEFDCEECAKERADKLNLTVLPSEKELFGTEYKVEKKCIEVCEPEHFDTKEAMKDAK